MQQRELTTKPIAFFGDIHGHWDFVKQITEVLDDHYWVFVGDYMDSFTEKVPRQIACLTQIRDWIFDLKAMAIPGNHDLHYVWRSYRCSGYKPDTQARMYPYQDFILGLPHCLLIDNVLVTHAGLTRPLHDKLIQKYPGEPIDQILEVEGNRQDSIVHECGIYRGGSAAWGGIYWCDWTAEFDPVPGLHQVFGHSNSVLTPKLFDEEYDGNLRFVRFCDSRSYNIDCLGRNGVFDILTYDNYKFGRIRLKYDSSGKLERASG